jgi:hypothetical protein
MHSFVIATGDTQSASLNIELGGATLGARKLALGAAKIERSARRLAHASSRDQRRQLISVAIFRCPPHEYPMMLSAPTAHLNAIKGRCEYHY